MKHLLIFIVLVLSVYTPQAQEKEAAAASTDIYRQTYPKTNELVHTKLQVKFDFSKAWMYGKAWLTLQPHFYSTDTLTLDAKGMDIKEVSIAKGNATTALKYTYDSLQLFIKLDKAYSAKEKYTIYISYVSKPNDLKATGSAAITDARGLYFINPTGADKDKPTQIWTQGETEANSVWMPTIDKPNQKSTEEIYMTVPAKYVTLSNGLLINQQKNPDGTRTDYWKMDLPHAPYLFFMGAGDFAIVKDHYKKMEVNYYVEKKYEPVAKKIFGHTPDMIGFYEKILGVPYQWPKYSQIVGRDYVSGAMENTTATLHQESAYQNARQLTEGNAWEETIAHELFHHWFGDLVTAESWSNLTVNESFANYSEYLWTEHEYGKDFADAHNFEDMQGYLQSGSEQKQLVRFNYADKEDMFDAVSYNKGGRILHMLRNYVGDDAFFKSLNNYLTANKFKTGEAAQLRLSFEEVTGEDLNWFWNQWYYGSGHPKLKIDYVYDDAHGNLQVIIQQTQADKIFRLPISIDIYKGSNKSKHKVWLQNSTDTFTFSYSQHPDLVNVDAAKATLCEKTDNKTTENFVYQFTHAPNYLDRKEALDYFAAKGLKELAIGLNDPFAGLRKQTIESLLESKFATDESIIKRVEEIAASENDKKTKAAALIFLGATGYSKYQTLFLKNADDSSYSVAGAALSGLTVLDPANGYSLAKKYAADAKGALGEAVLSGLITQGNEADYDVISNLFNQTSFGQEKVAMAFGIVKYLSRVTDISKIKKSIDAVMAVRKSIPVQYRNMSDPAFKQAFDALGKAKGKEIDTYIKESLSQ
ncbi:M1 family metallopeptidase [Ferruginibacter sp.]|uniref:M1 family metallopeptidase n=1 Tax=Ferruginibacter sp. TaxID=1940288 RepID=UPI00265A2D7C|nr:M1 family aminopeptidase [Ferruginibacter sp.]